MTNDTATLQRSSQWQLRAQQAMSYDWILTIYYSYYLYRQTSGVNVAMYSITSQFVNQERMRCGG